MSYHILIVDDSLPMRSVIIKTIKAAGYDNAVFFQAENGIAALKVLEEQMCDVVISDYNMPEMDGFTLVSKMQEDDIFKTIPVIIISTEGSQQRVEELLREFPPQ